MRRFIFPRSWTLALFRTSLLGAALWWLLTGTGVVHAQWPGGDDWKTDFERRSVSLDEIESGGPPRDGIPAVDHPVFVSPDQAARWLDPREPVIVLDLGGEARAYPLQILIYHEIVNDRIGERPVAITFCPLCNASIVFDRRVGARVLDFGTTGRLRKSDLVMYDRQTESWWQQFTGEAIVGELTGTVLDQIPAQIVAFGDFRAAHPDGPVLSRDTGHRRPYGRNPYRGYDRVGDKPFALREAPDPRLPAMERVIAVSLRGEHRLYPFGVLATTPVVNDAVNGTPVAVFSRQGTLSVLDAGQIRESRQIPSASAWLRRLGERTLSFRAREGAIVDEQTGSRWDLLGRAIDGPLAGSQLDPAPGGVHFAFAWLAFSPDSSIYAPAP